MVHSDGVGTICHYIHTPLLIFIIPLHTYHTFLILARCNHMQGKDRQDPHDVTLVGPRGKDHYVVFYRPEYDSGPTRQRRDLGAE